MTKARDLSQVPNASLGFKNRIINGAMTFSQRNGTSSVAVNDAAPYVLDRYFAQDATDGAFTVEQSSVAPAGFNNSMLITVTTADASIAAGQLARVVQRIEGFNVADFGFGATNAQPVTLSFWVRSSLTGTFGGALSNSAFNRSYPFSYTINAANTFEYKTITIAGDTTGTWVINNGIGLEVNFGLGVGSTYSGTAGSWSGSGLMSSTGATNLMGTSGATFYITGVQLEKGSTATSFDYRPYGTEELLCQRYYYKQKPALANTQFGNGYATSSTAFNCLINLPVTMRTNTTSLEQSGVASNFAQENDTTAALFTSVQTFYRASKNLATFNC